MYNGSAVVGRGYEGQEVVVSETTEVADHNALVCADRWGIAASFHAEGHSDVREDFSVAAIPALQQVLAEQPGRATQRHRAVDREPQSPACWALHEFMAPSTMRIGAVAQVDRSADFGRWGSSVGTSTQTEGSQDVVRSTRPTPRSVSGPTFSGKFYVDMARSVAPVPWGVFSSAVSDFGASYASRNSASSTSG